MTLWTLLPISLPHFEKRGRNLLQFADRGLPIEKCGTSEDTSGICRLRFFRLDSIYKHWVQTQSESRTRIMMRSHSHSTVIVDTCAHCISLVLLKLVPPMPRSCLLRLTRFVQWRTSRPRLIMDLSRPGSKHSSFDKAHLAYRDTQWVQRRTYS